MSDNLNFNQQAQIEQFKSVMQISVLALKSALIINGGAAIALLTFLGNMPSNDGMSNFVCALQYYIAGVALAAFANASAYLAQYRYLYEIKNNINKPKGHFVTYLTVLIVFLAYISFVIGGIEASDGFSKRI